MDTLVELSPFLTVIVGFIGVVMTIMSFNATRKKEAEARIAEAMKPFLTVRYNLYLDAIKAAAVIANADIHTPEEVTAARKRFRNLYVGELSMVEAPGVEQGMIQFAETVDKELIDLTSAQRAAYDLAHALRGSFAESWQDQSKLAVHHRL